MALFTPPALARSAVMVKEKAMSSAMIKMLTMKMDATVGVTRNLVSHVWEVHLLPWMFAALYFVETASERLVRRVMIKTRWQAMAVLLPAKQRLDGHVMVDQLRQRTSVKSAVMVSGRAVKPATMEQPAPVMDAVLLVLWNQLGTVLSP